MATAVLMTAAIALQNIGNDCIRIIAAVAAMVVGDSGAGGISSSRIAAGGSENIMNGVAAIANNSRKDDERW